MSRHDHRSKHMIPTGRWDELQKRRSIDLMHKVLGPLGDKNRERHFRMNATLCIHRALSAAEIAALPDEFTRAPALDIAGGPVAVLWENEQGAISTRPCVNPGHMIIDPKQPDLWVPRDCGLCPSCVARIDAEERVRSLDRTE